VVFLQHAVEVLLIRRTREGLYADMDCHETPDPFALKMADCSPQDVRKNPYFR
jgi:hypothetical protein